MIAIRGPFLVVADVSIINGGQLPDRILLSFLQRLFGLILSRVSTIIGKKKNITRSSGGEERNKDKYDENDPLSLFQRAFLYTDYVILGLFGHLREVLRYFGIEKRGSFENGREGYVPLYDGYARFYVNNLMPRFSLILNHPICGVPGSQVDVMERTSPDQGWTVRVTENVHKHINLASYNYLGFAQNSGPCIDKVENDVNLYGLSSCSARKELGSSLIIKELEDLTARFLGVEASMVFAMGFATNATNIPALIGKNCLVLSDELNHASIVDGCRISGATCRTFRHADMDDLEQKLIANITQGQQKKYRVGVNKVWKKIMIIVEGIYSMEGTIVNLPKVIELKKKYKAYLYLDEAHSIGSIGPHGRGVVDYYDCNPKDVDIMMGTFTKSFGSAGGYIGGSKELIAHLRHTSFSYIYGGSMSPPVASQIIAAMTVIMGEDGTNDGESRIKRLVDNTVYFRNTLKEMGFSLMGAERSPVVVVMLYNGAKVFIQRAFQMKGIALVAVGFPAVPFGKSRIRMCMSAGHTKEMLDKALHAFDELGDRMRIKYCKSSIDSKVRFEKQ